MNINSKLHTADPFKQLGWTGKTFGMFAIHNWTITEKGCAILNAIENNELDINSYTNFMKMEKEKMHFESDVKERKKRDKDFGKMIKNIKKQRRNNKY